MRQVVARFAPPTRVRELFSRMPNSCDIYRYLHKFSCFLFWLGSFHKAKQIHGVRRQGLYIFHHSKAHHRQAQAPTGSPSPRITERGRLFGIVVHWFQYSSPPSFLRFNSTVCIARRIKNYIIGLWNFPACFASLSAFRYPSGCGIWRIGLLFSSMFLPLTCAITVTGKELVSLHLHYCGITIMPITMHFNKMVKYHWYIIILPMVGVYHVSSVCFRLRGWACLLLLG